MPLLSQTSCTHSGGLWGKVLLTDMGYDASSQSISKDIGHRPKSIPRQERAMRMQLVATDSVHGDFLRLQNVSPCIPNVSAAVFGSGRLSAAVLFQTREKVEHAESV